MRAKKEPVALVHKKLQVDQEVARLLGLELRDVRAITKEFLQQIIWRLVELEAVHLEGFGEMYLKVRPGNCGKATLKAGRLRAGSPPIEVEIAKKYYVVFRKSPSFKAVIRARHGSPVTKKRVVGG